MGIHPATCAKLKEEGITKPKDLIDFDKDTLHQVAENLRKAPIPRTDKSQPVAHYVFGAKSNKRLLEAADLVRFYDTIGRELTADGLQYETVIRDFSEQWKALKLRKEEKEAEVPKISKALPVIKWTEAFDDYLNRTIGVRMIPLSYVTREKVKVPDKVPERAEDKAHSVGGSVVEDLVERASHEHPLFNDDNAKVYYLLEEATRSTQYAPSLKPFQKAKDGRKALISLRSQYAGKDKWEAEMKRQDDILHNRVWKGQANYPLEKFVALHRNAFVTMQQCAEHVTWQLPLEHTRVGYFLDAIQTSDAALQAAIAQVKADEVGKKSKRNNFETMAAYLLPYDPVAKKRQTNGARENDGGYISDVGGEISSGFGTKQGIGKTGVHLRFHKRAEYRQLTPEQKKELNEWRKTTNWGGQGKPTAKSPHSVAKQVKFAKKTKHPKSVAAAVSREISKQLKKTPTEDDLDAMIMALQTGSTGVSPPDQPNKKAKFTATPTTQVNTSALKSILRRVKNMTETQDDPMEE